MNKTLILVVEDDRPIRNLIVTTLKTHDYKYLAAENGSSAILEASSHHPDIVLLDLGLPDMEGVEVIKKIRTWSNMPIIVISARSEDTDKIEALDAGADDYITKPFSVREVVARVKANLRKSETHYDSLKSSHDSDSHKETKKQNTIKIGDLTLDLEKYEVNVNGTIVNLTLREFEVLKYLAQQQGQVVTRESLLEQVWGYEYYGDIRTVDVTVRRIRERIEKDTSNPKYLITKRGIGYYIPNFEK